MAAFCCFARLTRQYYSLLVFSAVHLTFEKLAPLSCGIHHLFPAISVKYYSLPSLLQAMLRLLTHNSKGEHVVQRKRPEQ